MSNTVIKIENLSKIYRLGEVGTGTLSHDLNRFVRMNILGQEDPYAKVGHVNDRTQKAEKGELIAALRDINLEVKEGEVLGIIGKNGAGKSTLLKLLSRVTSPTTGSIKVKGRLASLLEVGTGFHPEMTGRENIYMNGTIMGMRKWEIDRKLDEIVEFAGVAKYLDTPTKRYSSGMTVRLGFAIAAHLEPEILVVDEVLAVGDAEFQKKAIGKMQDVSTNEGRTILFVSHNMGSVKRICSNGIILKNGLLTFEGNIVDTIDKYILDSSSETANTPLRDRKIRKGSQTITFDNIKIINQKGIETKKIVFGESIKIKITISNKNKIHSDNIIFGFNIIDKYDTVIQSFVSDETLVTVNSNNPNIIIIEIPEILLRPDKYYVKLYLGESISSPNTACDVVEKAISIDIENTMVESGKRLFRPGSSTYLKNTIKYL